MTSSCYREINREPDFYPRRRITLERKGAEPVTRAAGQALLEPIDVEARAANHGSGPATVVISQVSDPEEPFLKPTRP